MVSTRPDRRGSAAFVWTDRALFVGDRSETTVHAHHAVELTVALDDEGLHVSLPEGPRLDACAGAIVRACAEHRLSIPGPKVAVFYIDPHCALAAGLHDWLGPDDLRALPTDLLASSRPRMEALLSRSAGLPEAELATAALLAPLATDPPRRLKDFRVEKARALIDEHLEAPLALPELAAKVGVSPRRLRHLFKEQVGLPTRRYLLWVRLRSALLEALAGKPMTQAAVEAGFADAAHFTRTCRSMFGLPPTAFTPVDAVFVAP